MIASVGERHLFGRLHCGQVKERSVCTSHSWTVSEKEVQESTVPNRREVQPAQVVEAVTQHFIFSCVVVF